MNDNVRKLRDQYPSGTRIKLIEMREEKRPVAAGTLGTVEKVDDIGTIHMIWDSGSSLGLIPGVDDFEIVPYLSPEEANEREALIFNEKYDESAYEDGKRQFSALPLDVAKALIQKGYMDPDAQSGSLSPAAQEFLDFCDNVEDCHIWSCHGFVEIASANQSNVYIQGLKSNVLPRSLDRVCEFANCFHNADFFSLSPDQGCYCSFKTY